MSSTSSQHSPNLVLVPTDLERRQIRGRRKWSKDDIRIELCGFGVIAAAARTAQLIARLKPDWVLLVGMAGTYDDSKIAIGDAACFDQVLVDGIGAGTGNDRLSAEQVGFAHWPGGEGTDASPIQDHIKLYRPRSMAPGGQLLTVCATSATQQEAEERKQRFPDVVAEDMEGFGVALACRLASIPLTIIRGISNRVGERDVRTWKMDEPIGAACDLAVEILLQCGAT